ncbi:peptide ABC transporter substrate-binding protein [Brevibacillus migulae]|uniref:peptide ABC transporter substrate-binding protein n=1 Tax=Brevibacillus migulae TaxID=1644114 RepID=UPI00106E163B|nr:peptide ABC transporter substrate-binding protein [Brevibacillus migulae]
MKKGVFFLFRSVTAAALLLTGFVTQSSAQVAAEGNESQAATCFRPALETEQVLRLNTGEPATLDPSRAEDVVSGAIIRAMFDGLVRLDRDGQPQASLASEIKVSKDKKTYLFKLRDAVWTNGDPVTAYDFAYAWLRTLNPKTGSGSAYQYFVIKNARAYNAGEAAIEDVGISVIDHKTLQVTLENPVPYFLHVAAFYYPQHQKTIENNKDWANHPKTLISNGPFKLKQWHHKRKLVLVKNDRYWDKEAVKLETIEFSMVDDANTELAMFENGELDWAGQPMSMLPVDAIQPLREQGKLITQPKATTYYIRFNTTRIPFTNEKIRKAFAYAINRQEIAEHIGQAGQTPLTGFVPVSAPLNPNGYFKDNDPVLAKQLLAEGMKELGLTKLPPLTYLFNTLDRNKKIAEVLQAKWKSVLGAEVTLLNKETKVFLDDQAQMKFDISRSSWTGDYNDAINFLEKFIEVEGTSNLTGWHNRKYSELIRKAYKEADEAKRKEYLLEAETILMDEMPVTGIFSDVNAWVQSESVKGIQIDPVGYIDFKWAYKE